MWLLAGLALAGPVDDARALAAEHRSARLSERTPAIPDADYATAAAGKVATGITKIDGHAARMVHGVGVFDAPIDAVWAAINDETRHGDLVPLSHVELVTGAPCEDRRKVLMVMPLPIVADRYWVNENRYASALARASGGQVRELVWASVPDPAAEPMSEAGRAKTAGLTPLGFNRGAWLLVGMSDGRTLGEYHSWVDPGGSVPAGPASSLAARSIATTFQSMERYAKRGALPCREATP